MRNVEYLYKENILNSGHPAGHGCYSKWPLPLRSACAVAQRGYPDIYLFCYVLDSLVAVDYDM